MHVLKQCTQISNSFASFMKLAVLAKKAKYKMTHSSNAVPAQVQRNNFQAILVGFFFPQNCLLIMILHD